MTKSKPVVLLILDGWGSREEKTGNAIACANTPTWDTLMAHNPHTLISGSGEDVGLPHGQMGNSEVGHLTLGAGRVIFQDLGRINHAIQTGEFLQNPILQQAFTRAKQTHKAVHIMGLLSPGGVHSHEEHILACLKMAQNAALENIHLHAFLDGRDTPPQSARASLEKIPPDVLASVSGRYFAMDRDMRWDRVKCAYDAICHGQSAFTAHNGMEALQNAYARHETDEFVKPTCILKAGQPVKIQPGDIIIYMNFRSDRARALTSAFIQKDFKGFDRGENPSLGEFVSLTEYDKNLPTAIAFLPQTHHNVLGEYLQNNHLTQLHIAETEKYAHVTFFFNGGLEKPYKGEERILIPSPKVATYDLQPQMHAPELTDALVDKILHGNFDFIICNYANADMVGHTGNFAATVKAIECLDLCLKRILAALNTVGGSALITADHGNAECMIDSLTQEKHTAHTTSLVPLVYVGPKKLTLAPVGGKLSDIAPTVLDLMGLAQPPEMTGHSLCIK